VTFVGWQAIDAVEQERGKPLGRPRVKFVRVDEMLDAARGTTVSG
jgi:ferredoxin--NADP+ reductase